MKIGLDLCDPSTRKNVNNCAMLSSVIVRNNWMKMNILLLFIYLGML
jgi:hypothetical protein